MLRALLASLVLAFAAAPLASAQTTRVTYEVSILSRVTIGEIRYEATWSAGQYAARANVRTSGAARIFDQTQIAAVATGQMNASSPAWTSYDLSHAYDDKFRRIHMTRAAAVTSQIEPRYTDMGVPSATPEEARRSHDPVTAFFALGRQVATARACAGAAYVFDGRQHYRLRVTGSGGAQTFAGRGYSGPALRCTMRYEPISGFSNLAEARRAPTGEAWFALRGEYAPLVRLTVQTPIGAARLEATRVEFR